MEEEELEMLRKHQVSIDNYIRIYIYIYIYLYLLEKKYGISINN